MIKKLINTPPLFLGGQNSFLEEKHLKILEESSEFSLEEFLMKFFKDYNYDYSSFIYKEDKNKYQIDTIYDCIRSLFGIWSICKTYKKVKLSQLIETLINLQQNGDINCFICCDIKQRVFSTEHNWSDPNNEYDEFNLEWKDWINGSFTQQIKKLENDKI